MNDRLRDISARAVQWAQNSVSNFANKPQPPVINGKLGSKTGAGDNGDVEMGNRKEQAKHMEHFFREVESIKADIEFLKIATRTIADINESALQAVRADEENELSRQLRPLVDQTNKRAKQTKTMLGLLKEETKKLNDKDSIKQCDER